MLFKSFIFLTMLLIGINAHAWREGGGGDGVYLNERVYLLDLVENGSEEFSEATPFCQSTFINEQVRSWAATLALQIPEKMIQQKLCQIYSQNPMLALGLLAGFRNLQWQWLSVPLRELDDEGSNLKLPREQLVQIGLRVNQTIHLQKNLWLRLNPRHQAALLFHEIIYAFMIPVRNSAGIDTNSPRVRRMVGFIFSEEMNQFALSSILRTEAPHLLFSAPDAIDPAPVWDFDMRYLLMYPKWSSDIALSNGEVWRSENKSARPSMPWLAMICNQAIKEKKPMTLALEVNLVEVVLTQMGLETSEEFYLRLSLMPESHVYSRVITPTESHIRCVEQVAEGLDLVRYESQRSP